MSKHLAKKSKHIKDPAQRRGNLTRAILIALISLLMTLNVALCCGYFFINGIFDRIETPAEGEWDDAAAEIAPAEKVADQVTNIALFGIDTRKNSTKGRSDSIIILSIDKAHDKIKLSSVARDSYVKIDGHGKDKITHAYVYGGAKLAVKTLNQNYDMDITDYVTVNFYGLIDIVDAMGGVTVHVDASEKNVMNNTYIPELRKLGHSCQRITETGTQTLTGAQALAYTRNRYTGGDVERGNRQKEVLNALYEKLSSKTSITQLMKVADTVLKHCQTSLSSAEITELAAWYLSASPTVENFSLPTENCNAKKGSDCYINGVWYYIYDLDIATKELHAFIEEPKEAEQESAEKSKEKEESKKENVS